MSVLDHKTVQFLLPYPVLFYNTPLHLPLLSIAHDQQHWRS